METGFEHVKEILHLISSRNTYVLEFRFFLYKEKCIRLIETDKQNISIQKETFLYNTKLQILQETNEIKN